MVVVECGALWLHRKRRKSRRQTEDIIGFEDELMQSDIDEKRQAQEPVHKKKTRNKKKKQKQVGRKLSQISTAAAKIGSGGYERYFFWLSTTQVGLGTLGHRGNDGDWEDVAQEPKLMKNVQEKTGVQVGGSRSGRTESQVLYQGKYRHNETSGGFEIQRPFNRLFSVDSIRRVYQLRPGGREFNVVTVVRTVEGSDDEEVMTWRFKASSPESAKNWVRVLEIARGWAIPESPPLEKYDVCVLYDFSRELDRFLCEEIVHDLMESGKVLAVRLEMPTRHRHVSSSFVLPVRQSTNVILLITRETNVEDNVVLQLQIYQAVLSEKNLVLATDTIPPSQIGSLNYDILGETKRPRSKLSRLVPLTHQLSTIREIDPICQHVSLQLFQTYRRGYRQSVEETRELLRACGLKGKEPRNHHTGTCFPMGLNDTYVESVHGKVRLQIESILLQTGAGKTLSSAWRKLSHTSLALALRPRRRSIPTPHGGENIALVITGAPEIGKTGLGLRIANSSAMKRFFFDGIFWLSCRDGEPCVERMLFELLHELGVNAEEVQQEVFGTRSKVFRTRQLTGRLREVLQERQALLILDDLASPSVMDAFASVSRHLIAIVPKSSIHHVAILNPAQVFDLGDEIPRREAHAVLTLESNTGDLNDEQRGDVNEVAKLCENNLTALSMVGYSVRNEYQGDWRTALEELSVCMVNSTPALDVEQGCVKFAIEAIANRGSDGLNEPLCRFLFCLAVFVLDDTDFAVTDCMVLFDVPSLDGAGKTDEKLLMIVDDDEEEEEEEDDDGDNNDQSDESGNNRVMMMEWKRRNRNWVVDADEDADFTREMDFGLANNRHLMFTASMYLDKLVQHGLVIESTHWSAFARSTGTKKVFRLRPGVREFIGNPQNREQAKQVHLEVLFRDFADRVTSYDVLAEISMSPRYVYCSQFLTQHLLRTQSVSVLINRVLLRYEWVMGKVLNLTNDSQFANLVDLYMMAAGASLKSVSRTQVILVEWMRRAIERSSEIYFMGVVRSNSASGNRRRSIIQEQFASVNVKLKVCEQFWGRLSVLHPEMLLTVVPARENITLAQEREAVEAFEYFVACTDRDRMKLPGLHVISCRGVLEPASTPLARTLWGHGDDVSAVSGWMYHKYHRIPVAPLPRNSLVVDDGDSDGQMDGVLMDQNIEDGDDYLGGGDDDDDDDDDDDGDEDDTRKYRRETHLGDTDLVDEELGGGTEEERGLDDGDSHGLLIPVSASRDKTLSIWDLSSGTVKSVLEGHTREIDAVYIMQYREVRSRAKTLSPLTPIVLSGGRDKAVGVWNAKTGQRIRWLRGCSSSIVSVVGYAKLSNATVVAGEREGGIVIWNGPLGLTSGGQRGGTISPPPAMKTVRKLSLHSTNSVNALAVIPGMDLVLSGARKICIWKPVPSSNGGDQIVHEFTGHRKRKVNVIKTHWDQTERKMVVVSASVDGPVLVWEIESQLVLRKIPDVSGVFDISIVKGFGSMDYIVVAKRQKIQVHGYESGNLIASFDAHSELLNGIYAWRSLHESTGKGVINILSYSPEANIKYWKLFMDFGGISEQVELLHTGAILSMWSKSANAKIMTLQSKKPKRVVSKKATKRVQSRPFVDLRATEQLLCAACKDSLILCDMDLSSRARVANQALWSPMVDPGAPSKVLELSLVPGAIVRTFELCRIANGTTFAVVGISDGSIQVWVVSPRYEHIHTLQDHEESVRTVSVFRDTDTEDGDDDAIVVAGKDSFLLLTGSRDFSLKIWRVNTDYIDLLDTCDVLMSAPICSRIFLHKESLELICLAGQQNGTLTKWSIPVNRIQRASNLEAMRMEQDFQPTKEPEANGDAADRSNDTNPGNNDFSAMGEGEDLDSDFNSNSDFNSDFSARLSDGVMSDTTDDEAKYNRAQLRAMESVLVPGSLEAWDKIEKGKIRSIVQHGDIVVYLCTEHGSDCLNARSVSENGKLLWRTVLGSVSLSNTLSICPSRRAPRGAPALLIAMPTSYEALLFWQLDNGISLGAVHGGATARRFVLDVVVPEDLSLPCIAYSGSQQGKLRFWDLECELQNIAPVEQWSSSWKSQFVIAALTSYRGKICVGPGTLITVDNTKPDSVFPSQLLLTADGTLSDAETMEPVGQLPFSVSTVRTMLYYYSKTLGPMVIISSNDKRVTVWSMSLGTELRRFQCSQHGFTNALAVCQDRSGREVLLTGSSKNHVEIWDLRGGTLCNSFQLHNKPIKCVDTIGGLAVSTTDLNDVRVWNVDTLQEEQQFRTHSSIKDMVLHDFDHISNRLVVAVFVTSRASVEIWDIHSGTNLRTIQTQFRSFTCVDAFHLSHPLHSGGVLGSESLALCGTNDGGIVVIDLISCTVLTTSLSTLGRLDSARSGPVRTVHPLQLPSGETRILVAYNRDIVQFVLQE